MPPASLLTRMRSIPFSRTRRSRADRATALSLRGRFAWTVTGLAPIVFRRTRESGGSFRTIAHSSPSIRSAGISVSSSSRSTRTS